MDAYRQYLRISGRSTFGTCSQPYAQAADTCFFALAVGSIALLFLRGCTRLPDQIAMCAAAIAGAPFGAHCAVQAMYYSWGQGSPVYALMPSNRDLWCPDKPTCKLFFCNFCAFCVGSWVAQWVVFHTRQRVSARDFEPVNFVHPSCFGKEVPLDKLRANDSWNHNLRTPPSAWLFFACIVGLTTAVLGAYAFMVDWAGETYFSIGLFYILLNGFCIWSVVEFFMLQMFFHVVRFLFDVPALPWKPSCDDTGVNCLPATGRTILSYCLLSQDVRSSEDTFQTALRSHLSNLDPTGRVTTAVVSVSSSLSIVECEMRCRDRCRQAIQRHLGRELQAIVPLLPRGTLDTTVSGFVAGVGSVEPNALAEALRVSDSDGLGNLGGDRSTFWLGVLESIRANGTTDVDEFVNELKRKVEECAQHFIYLHRTCRILKKTGQYQDLIILGSTGNNQAYTYLEEDYGRQGRVAGSPCFGFSGNLEVDQPSSFVGKPRADVSILPSDSACSAASVTANVDGGPVSRENDGIGGVNAQISSSNGQDDGKLLERTAALERLGLADIELVASAGRDPQNRYWYTLVLDSDTFCPPGSVRRLVEVAQHEDNKHFGIINANLANDYAQDSRCTWHMWRNALMEVSTVDLQRGQFWIFGRVGFYGKGLIRNEMYLERLIGTPNRPVEALPIDILSHDTVEAKLLKPAVVLEVTLYEDVARNPISGLAQSTRWMLGEIRNASYGDSAYQILVTHGMDLYVRATKCQRRHRQFVRWPEVPCSAGAAYLSHQGVRLFHIGPALMLVNLFTSIVAVLGWGLHLVVVPAVSFYVLLFTILALFLLPKMFLVIHKLPSLRCGHRLGNSVATKTQTVASSGIVGSNTQLDGEALVEAPAEKLGCWGILWRQLLLGMIELCLSVLLYGPELVVGFLRLLRALHSQITGRQSWVPQDVVEKEIDDKLSLWYVFRQTWVVHACGIAYLVYTMRLGILSPVNGVLCASWILYPVSTYVMCLSVKEHWKHRWIWTWVMSIKSSGASTSAEM
eukprot:TRINITY_DN15053_c0_g1_i1.p1 TRINITY_DN15053_c0_g1~~TRINITY_DN15053_c0_g1_i1.p1  ORF type:complete len:1197 (-),score=178.02 TRINITY_DN15053_c0_g1_i1:19-3090(-)